MKLLLALFFCHFLGDYTWLSRPWMLSAKKYGNPIGPIICHASIHAALMLIAITISQGNLFPFAVPLAGFQLLTHAAIDIAKGRLNARYTSLQNPANVAHWVLFGLDQYTHTVIILLMWYATLPR